MTTKRDKFNRYVRKITLLMMAFILLIGGASEFFGGEKILEPGTVAMFAGILCLGQSDIDL